MYVVYGAMSDRLAPPPVLPDAGPRPADAEVIDFGGDPAAALIAAAPEPTARTPETALLREEMVLNIQSRAAAVGTMQRMVRDERSTVVPFLVIGLCFAMAAVLSLFAILFLEREGEYATLRSMGYGRGSIARIVFAELAVLAVLGLLTALVGWAALDAYIVHAVSKALFPLPFAYRLSDLVTVALPTLAALAVAAVFAVGAIQRIDLRAALTARAIE
jgi:putative ABC transport system permease protein